MFRLSRLVCFFLAVFVVSSLFTRTTGASTVSFWVNRGQTESKSISLQVDDRVLVQFTVTGQGDSAVAFCMVDPDGGVESESSHVGSFRHSFVCDEAGEYVLRFSSVNPEQDVFVALDYEIEHYVLGMPQMLFLAIVVVLLCVGAMAVFILMGKPR